MIQKQGEQQNEQLQVPKQHFQDMSNRNSVDSLSDVYQADEGQRDENFINKKQQMMDEVNNDLQQIDTNIKNLNESQVKQLNFQKRKNSNKTYKISDVFFNSEIDFPIKKHYLEEFENLFQQGIIKPFENKNFRDRFLTIIKSNVVQQLAEMLFWLIFVNKFPAQISSLQAIENLQNKISNTYTFLFHSLPRPKENFTNNLIFTITYVIHKAFYDIFPEDRVQFTLRFVLDCYHIIIIQLNGVSVTDFYIQLYIDRIFSYKFMNYYKEKNKKKYAYNIETKPKALQAVPFLQRLENQEKNQFFGQPIDIPTATSQDEFTFQKKIKEVFQGQFSTNKGTNKKVKNNSQDKGSQQLLSPSSKTSKFASQMRSTSGLRKQQESIRSNNVKSIRYNNDLNSKSSDALRSNSQYKVSQNSISSFSKQSPSLFKNNKQIQQDAAKNQEFPSSPKMSNVQEDAREGEEDTASPRNNNNFSNNTIIRQLRKLQSFLQVGNTKANQGVDRQTYNKMKRNKKVDLEQLHQFENEEYSSQLDAGPYIKQENISPSLRIKTSGRDITYNRLRYNINQLSPSVADTMLYQERSLPDIKKKNILHPIDRVVQHNDFLYQIEIMKRTHQVDDATDEGYSSSNINNTNIASGGTGKGQGQNIVSQSSTQLDKEKQSKELKKGGKDNNSTVLSSAEVNSSQNDVSAQVTNINKNEEIKSPTAPEKQKRAKKNLILQYDLTGKVDENGIKKNPLMYKDMLELQAVLDHYKEKMSNIPSAKRLVERKHKLGKKDIYFEKNQELDKLLKKIQEDNFLNQKYGPQKKDEGSPNSKKFTQIIAGGQRASTSPQPVKGMLGETKIVPAQMKIVQIVDQQSKLTAKKKGKMSQSNDSSSSSSDEDSSQKQEMKTQAETFGLMATTQGSFSGMEDNDNNDDAGKGFKILNYNVDEKEKMQAEEAEKLEKYEKDIDIYDNNYRYKEGYAYRNNVSEYAAKYSQYVSNQNNYQQEQKDLMFKLIKQKAALSKKGAGWAVYQHLI